MGWWYWIGVSAGVGAAWGIAVSGTEKRISRRVLSSNALASLVGGALFGLLISGPHRGHWSDVAAGAVGCLGAYLGAAIIVAGAFRRGGTRLGLAVIMFGMALITAGIAFIPAAGFVEAVVLPTLAFRLRRLQPERYAGLRTLAKD